jgi:hypothetical protein
MADRKCSGKLADAGFVGGKRTMLCLNPLVREFWPAACYPGIALTKRRNYLQTTNRFLGGNDAKNFYFQFTVRGGNTAWRL